MISGRSVWLPSHQIKIRFCSNAVYGGGSSCWGLFIRSSAVCWRYTPGFLGWELKYLEICMLQLLTENIQRASQLLQIPVSSPITHCIIAPMSPRESMLIPPDYNLSQSHKPAFRSLYNVNISSTAFLSLCHPNVSLRPFNISERSSEQEEWKRKSFSEVSGVSLSVEMRDDN